MRILLDVLGAPEKSGGMRLHAHEVIRSWLETFPEDSLVVLGPVWVASDFGLEPRVEHVALDNLASPKRAFGQLISSAWIARRRDVDAVVSLSPIVTPLFRGITVCFQHDWRHVKIPSEFSRVQRAYRRLWVWSARWASVTACISEKTLHETLSVAPTSAVVLVENGGDHPRRWEIVKRDSGERRTIVTFGHHNNKRPELLIDALACLDSPERESLSLVVLGATDSYQSELIGRAEAAAVRHLVSFPGFVDEEDYRRRIATCDLVALVSSDEGYGLPIAEAAFFGIPALVTADSGVADLHRKHARVVEVPPLPDPVARGIVEGISAARQSPGDVRPWRDVVLELRGHLVHAIEG